MEEFGQDFIQGMKTKLDIELMGVASVEASGSKELKEKVIALLPNFCYEPFVSEISKSEDLISIYFTWDTSFLLVIPRARCHR